MNSLWIVNIFIKLALNNMLHNAQNIDFVMSHQGNDMKRRVTIQRSAL